MLSNRTPGWIRPFCRLAIANTTSSLMVPLAGLIDTAFLGHLSDVRYLNGVALASVIFNVIYWGCSFFRMGTTGLVAQAVGRLDETDVWLILCRNALLALGAGSALLALQRPIAAVGFYFLQMGPSVREAAIAFYDGRIVGAPAVLLNFVLLGWLLGRSQGRQVVWLAAVGNGSNILLDYWFIVRFGWGSYGAGLATALSQYVMLAVGIGIVVSSTIPWSLWPWIKEKLWQPAALKALFGLNSDILIRTLMLVLAMSSFTNFSSSLGETVLGVNALLMQIVLMSAHFMDGVALAVESYAGKFFGRRSVGDLMWLLLLGAGGSVFLGIAIALTLAIWPVPFFGLLTGHTQLLTQIPTYVLWLFPVLGFGGVAFALDGYFLGLTAGCVLRNSVLIAVLLGFFPLALVAVRLESPQLLWLSLAVLMALRTVTLLRQVPIMNQQLLVRSPEATS